MSHEQSWQKDEELQEQIQLTQQQTYNKKLKYASSSIKPTGEISPPSFEYEEIEHSTRNSNDNNHNELVNFSIEPTIQRKKYGNMLILYESEKWLISLGPNCIFSCVIGSIDWFFTFAYLSFTFASVYLVGLVNSTMKNEYFVLANLCMCVAQNLSYVLVAFSNPGIVLPCQSIPLSSQQLKQHRYCKTCIVIQQRYTYHCRECNVCIENYDHHCPWTSKCIGGGNMKRFYFFVIMTPIYIFYYMITFMVCMASMTMEHNQNLKIHQKEAAGTF